MVIGEIDMTVKAQNGRATGEEKTLVIIQQAQCREADRLEIARLQRLLCGTVKARGLPGGPLGIEVHEVLARVACKTCGAVTPFTHLYDSWSKRPSCWL